VAALQDMVDKANGGNLQNRWPADASRVFGSSILHTMHLMEAWNEVPVNFVVGILDTVRNRVLSFALEIEEENPDVGDTSSASPPLSPAKVQQIFNTTINGNVGNIASGSEHFTQSTVVEIGHRDFEGLAELLKECGLDAKDIKELRTAIKTDGSPKESRFGSKVAEWFGKTMSKSAAGLLKVGTDVAGQVIGSALKKYYGLSD
jgi:hypothetical protein